MILAAKIVLFIGLTIWIASIIIPETATKILIILYYENQFSAPFKYIFLNILKFTYFASDFIAKSGFFIVIPLALLAKKTFWEPILENAAEFIIR